jgi:hypothetical protein
MNDAKQAPHGVYEKYELPLPFTVNQLRVNDHEVHCAGPDQLRR